MDGFTHRDYVRDGVYLFEQCRLDPVSRQLTRAGRTVKLPARLFDTLLCLIGYGGELVDRDTLMRAVWSDRVVDDNSIGRAVSSLRAALKEHGAPDTLIVTAAGRGYRFGALVAFEPRAATLTPEDAASPPAPIELQHTESPEAWSAPPARLRGRLGLLVCLGLAACITLLFAWRRDAITPPGPAISFAPSSRSIAVLPFANLSDDPRKDYLADGIADELIDALGRIGPLQVADRRSSFLFKTRQDDIGGIARTLNVGKVLEGSIRRDGTRVRIAVQLIDAISGYQLWSHSYDREPGDILALEGEIAASVIASLKIILLPDEIARLTVGGTANPQAFDDFRTGLALSRALDNELRKKAIPYFTAAIALDPLYAMAFAERANALASIGADAPTTDLRAARAMIEEAIHDGERAVALAPDLGEAHAALGLALLDSTTDFVRADAEFTRALALSPGNATILRRYAWCQMDLGHLEAGTAAARRMVVLDPLTPTTYRALARILSLGGHYDEAMAALQVARRLTPADPSADATALGFLEMYRGDGGAARQACLGRTDPYALLCLSIANHVLGRQQDAEAAFAQLRGMLGDNGATFYASMMAAWGKDQDALQWLDTAYRVRDPGIGDIRLDPFLRRLSRTAEYRRIEQDLKFPPVASRSSVFQAGKEPPSFALPVRLFTPPARWHPWRPAFCVGASSMANFVTIEAEARARAGKGAARATRRAGRVPAVIYGAKQAPTLISLEPKAILGQIKQGGWRSRLFDLKVGGESTRALMRDVQFHPVTDVAEHVDFQRLAPGEQIRVSVAVHYMNDATSPGIKKGGVLNVVRHTVEVWADPENVPPFFEADLATLDINDNIRWHDLQGTGDIRPTIAERDFVIATVAPPTRTAEMAAEDAAAAAAPAAAPAKGKAPAKGAAPAKAAAAPAAKAPAKAPAAKKK